MNAVEFGEKLPEGWVRTSLENISTIILGQSPPSSTYNKEKTGLPFFQGKTEFGELHPVAKVWCDSPKKIAKKNDILISVRAPVGSTNISTDTCCIGRGLSAIRTSETVDMMYVFYHLRHMESHIAQKGTGTTFKAITGKQLRSIKLSLPPLSEQKRIVVKIKSIFAQIDAVRERLEMLTSQTKSVSGSLGALRSSVLKAAFEGKLTNKWRIKNNQNFNFIKITLENLILFSKNGFTGRPNTNDEGTPRLGIESITNSNSIFVNTEKCKFIDILDSKLNNYIAKKGDLFFCRQNGNKHYVGKCAVLKSITKPMIFSDSLIQFRIDVDKIIPEYIAHFANSIFGRVQIEKYCSTTAGNYSINGTNLKQIIINFPSLNEQKRIVAKIESIFAEIDAIEQSVKFTLQLLDQLKNSTLKQAFEGKLVPPDPNDEPAEFVLPKIK